MAITMKPRRIQEPKGETPKVIGPEANGYDPSVCEECGKRLPKSRQIAYGGKGRHLACESPKPVQQTIEQALDAAGVALAADRGDPSQWRDLLPETPELPSLSAVGRRRRMGGVLSTTTPAGVAAIEPPAEPVNGDASREAEDRGTGVPPVNSRGETPLPQSRGETPLPPDKGRWTTRVGSLGRNRFNPRENFDEAELEKLAESLKRHGQLQPIGVRLVPDGVHVEPLVKHGRTRATYEIVYGERRALAAVRARIDRVDIEVLPDCDDATACELALTENADREDISQVEYARGLQRLADLRGLDPKGVAARVGLSDQHVRNLLRLLKSPRDWQQRVIDGKIDGTHLRLAVPYLHVPAIAEELARELDKAKEKPALTEWTEMVYEVVREEGVRVERPVHTSDYRKQGWVEISKKHPRWAELDVVEVGEDYRGKRQIALNAELAKELLDEREAEWQKRNKRKSSGKMGEPVIREEKRRKAEEARQKRKTVLRAIVAYWKSWLCSRHIVEDLPRCRDAILAAAIDINGFLGHGHHLKEFVGKLIKRPWYSLSSRHIHSMTADQLQRFTADVAARLFWHDELVGRLDRRTVYVDDSVDREVSLWLKQLAIDPVNAWREKGEDGKQLFLGPLTEAWLSCLDDDQLRDLAAEWKVPLIHDREAAAHLRQRLVSNPARVMPMPADLLAIVKGTKGGKKRKPR